MNFQNFLEAFLIMLLGAGLVALGDYTKDPWFNQAGALVFPLAVGYLGGVWRGASQATK